MFHRFEWYCFSVDLPLKGIIASSMLTYFGGQYTDLNASCNRLHEAFRSVVLPTKNVSVDEAMMPTMHT